MVCDNISTQNVIYLMTIIAKEQWNIVRKHVKFFLKSLSIDHPIERLY
jgi:hypothetical protein